MSRAGNVLIVDYHVRKNVYSLGHLEKLNAISDEDKLKLKFNLLGL